MDRMRGLGEALELGGPGGDHKIPDEWLDGSAIRNRTRKALGIGPSRAQIRNPYNAKVRFYNSQQPQVARVMVDGGAGRYLV